MPDEEMDDIIREAASQHHPAYDDKAWEKMQQLLNKHLPQKKDRKKPLLFLLIFLLLGGSLFVLVHPWNGNQTPIVKNSKLNKPIQPNRQQKPSGTNASFIAVDNAVKKENSPAAINLQAPVEKNTVIQSGFIPINQDMPGKTGIVRSIQNITRNSRLINKVVIASVDNIPAEESELVTVENSNMITYISPDQPKGKSLIAINDDITEKPVIEKAAVKIISKDLTSSKGTTGRMKKNSGNFRTNFGITLSAGPDLSFVSVKTLGKMNFSYGAGLSYTFAKKITLRSGFYISRKIYSADPGDYHPPAGSLAYYPGLEKVDANCKIYEIPLNISYNFGYRKNHHWFGNAGLSSFLMKTETYNYFYKDYYGQPDQKEWTIKNKNNHYFSVLTISGGYQYNINDRFAIIAEPYLKLPLAGVGFGKIKLNSGGLLFTLNIQPFAKK